MTTFDDVSKIKRCVTIWNAWKSLKKHFIKIIIVSYTIAFQCYRTFKIEQILEYHLRLGAKKYFLKLCFWKSMSKTSCQSTILKGWVWTRLIHMYVRLSCKKCKVISQTVEKCRGRAEKQIVNISECIKINSILKVFRSTYTEITLRIAPSSLTVFVHLSHFDPPSEWNSFKSVIATRLECLCIINFIFI